MSDGKRNLRELDTLKMLSTPAPTVDWMIGGVAAGGHLSLLAGREKVGKSLLMLHLAAGVANAKAEGGTRYVGGPFGFGVSGGRVLLVDAENGSAVLHRRIQTCGLLTEAAEHLRVIDAFGFDLGDTVQLDALTEIVTTNAIDMFVIDGFRAVWRGQELESADVAAALDPLRHLCHTSGAAGVLLHHARKAAGESADSYRGGTGIGAAVEHIVEVARVSRDPDTRRRRVANPSSRFALEADTKWIRLAVEGGGVKIEAAEPMLAAGQPRRAEIAELLLETLLRAGIGGPVAEINAADLTRSVGLVPPNGTVRRALDELKTHGYVIQGEGGAWSCTATGREFYKNGASA